MWKEKRRGETEVTRNGEVTKHDGNALPPSPSSTPPPSTSLPLAQKGTVQNLTANALTFFESDCRCCQMWLSCVKLNHGKCPFQPMRKGRLKYDFNCRTLYGLEQTRASFMSSGRSSSMITVPLPKSCWQRPVERCTSLPKAHRRRWQKMWPHSVKKLLLVRRRRSIVSGPCTVERFSWRRTPRPTLSTTTSRASTQVSHATWPAPASKHRTSARSSVSAPLTVSSSTQQQALEFVVGDRLGQAVRYIWQVIQQLK